MKKSVLAALPLLATLMATMLACGGGNAASGLAKAPEFEAKNQSKCVVAKSQAEPLIVEWPSAARGQLETRTRQGVVAVRYEGCEMKLVSQCTVPMKYGYEGFTRKRDHVTIHDADDLYAQVPVGAAKLEAKLAHSGELNVAMTIVGRYQAERMSVRREELQGECEDATHVITAVTVGAFDFFAGADAKVGGGMTVMNAGVGAQSAAHKEMINEDGEEKACESAKADDKAPPFGCGALIRIEVAAIRGAKATPEPVATPAVTPREAPTARTPATPPTPAPVAPPSGAADLDSAVIRIVYTAARADDARRAQARLREHGATAILSLTSDDGNGPHLGKIYVESTRHRDRLSRIISLVSDIEPLTPASGDTSDEVDFNMWIARPTGATRTTAVQPSRSYETPASGAQERTIDGSASMPDTFEGVWKCSDLGIVFNMRQVGSSMILFYDSDVIIKRARWSGTTLDSAYHVNATNADIIVQCTQPGAGKMECQFGGTGKQYLFTRR
jgi:hypothetical protein